MSICPNSRSTGKAASRGWISSLRTSGAAVLISTGGTCADFAVGAEVETGTGAVGVTCSRDASITAISRADSGLVRLTLRIQKTETITTRIPVAAAMGLMDDLPDSRDGCIAGFNGFRGAVATITNFS
jgi:hypothetical protein